MILTIEKVLVFCSLSRQSWPNSTFLLQRLTPYHKDFGAGHACVFLFDQELPWTVEGLTRYEIVVVVDNDTTLRRSVLLIGAEPLSFRHLKIHILLPSSSISSPLISGPHCISLGKCFLPRSLVLGLLSLSRSIRYHSRINASSKVRGIPVLCVLCGVISSSSRSVPRRSRLLDHLPLYPLSALPHPTLHMAVNDLPEVQHTRSCGERY